MLADESGQKLYTLQSLGYPFSGAGSEVALGEGLIGLAAARRTTVRLTHMARELSYSHAVQDAARREGQAIEREQVIPLPTLPSVGSQMVVPMLAYRQLVGVICLQSHEAGTFQGRDEAIIGILANQVAMAIASMKPSEGHAAPSAPGEPEHEAQAIQVKHYNDDDSVFLDNEYLIKGVAGGVFWRLLQQHEQEGREEFSNRELRLDTTLDLPDIKDNLEARLILLRRRLDERCEAIRIERTGRGRFRLVVRRPLKLVAAKGGGPL
jgi:GAF domain-containing protein